MPACDARGAATWSSTQSLGATGRPRSGPAVARCGGGHFCDGAAAQREDVQQVSKLPVDVPHDYEPLPLFQSDSVDVGHALQQLGLPHKELLDGDARQPRRFWALHFVLAAAGGRTGIGSCLEQTRQAHHVRWRKHLWQRRRPRRKQRSRRFTCAISTCSAVARRRGGVGRSMRE